jgi:hypothetical protein
MSSRPTGLPSASDGAPLDEGHQSLHEAADQSTPTGLKSLDAESTLEHAAAPNPETATLPPRPSVTRKSSGRSRGAGWESSTKLCRFERIALWR